MFEPRRQHLMEAMEDAVAIFFAAPETLRNNDVVHAYRQDSDFYYLTGFEEMESVLVFTPHHKTERVTLFLRVRDPEREIWDGARLGVDEAPTALKIDAAYPIEDLARRLPDLLIGATRLFHTLGDPDRDRTVLDAMQKAKRARRQGHATVRDILDPAPLLHEMRLIKSADEIAAMRASAQLAARGHRIAMESSRPGLNEYHLEAVIEHEWRMNGSRRNAYGSIVGSGKNACILHYHENNCLMQDGDLVLIDAGCELDYQASDITRTWPVNGRFTDAQRAVYQVVLDAQEAAIAACVVGRSFHDVHDIALRVLVEGMCKLELLEGTPEACLEDESYKRYYMHKTSHWIGMDVHDVGAYYKCGSSRPLEPGMVLTVEPGLYIAPDDTQAPEALRGIGIRIEDDVLVTDGAPDVLSADAPKTVAALEAIIGVRALPPHNVSS